MKGAHPEEQQSDTGEEAGPSSVPMTEQDDKATTHQFEKHKSP